MLQVPVATLLLCGPMRLLEGRSNAPRLGPILRHKPGPADGQDDRLDLCPSSSGFLSFGSRRVLLRNAMLVAAPGPLKVGHEAVRGLFTQLKPTNELEQVALLVDDVLPQIAFSPELGLQVPDLEHQTLALPSMLLMKPRAVFCRSSAHLLELLRQLRDLDLILDAPLLHFNLPLSLVPLCCIVLLDLGPFFIHPPLLLLHPALFLA